MRSHPDGCLANSHRVIGPQRDVHTESDLCKYKSKSSFSLKLNTKKRKRDEPTGEEEVEGRRVAKQPRKKAEEDMNKPSMDSEVEMSDMEAVVHQSTLYDELYRAYMLLREPLD